MSKPLADPAIPGSVVVAETHNCEVVLTPAGFYSRCLNCTYVTEITPSKSVARRWANRHDEDQPNDGRAC